MANEKHLEIIRQGVEQWNQWREDNPEIEPDLSDVDLSNLKLNNANLSDTDLRRSILKNTDFRGANLVRADLRSASINKASFNLAKMREANFSEAYLRASDLSEADLKRAYFIRADLVRVELCETDLTKADFRWAYLIATDLRMANLTRADLRWAHLSESNLSEANLRKANLIKASIMKTNLHHSDLKSVFLAWTHFGDVDLSVTKELFTARHFGPSSIGIDTIMRSDGKIPESFLRETGVSDNIIQNIGLLTEKGLSHQSCFISHSGRDLEFAQKLYTDLQNRGVRCWFAHALPPSSSVWAWPRAVVSSSQRWAAASAALVEAPRMSVTGNTSSSPSSSLMVSVRSNCSSMCGLTPARMSLPPWACSCAS